jgi:hypothetical protein
MRYIRSPQPRQAPRSAVLALSLGLLALACGPPETPGQTAFANQTVGGGPDAGQVDVVETQARVLPTMDGIWLQYNQVSTCVDIVFSEETFKRDLFLVETIQDDFGVLEEHWTACEIELSPVLGLQPSVTPALLSTSYPITTRGGLVSGTILGSGYVSAALAELWGLDLTDPVNEPLPDDPDDPSIVDSDRDGRPGATLVFGDFCESFVAQRTLTYYVGEYTAPDRIEGEAISGNKQLLIGATESLCEATYEVRSNHPRSSFVRIRVDGQGGSLDLDTDGDGEVECNEVIPYKDTLFERVEIDDRFCEVE